MGEWKFAFASVTGLSHINRGEPCQDASCCMIADSANGTPVLVSIVSDGAGSAANGLRGAKLICSSLVEKAVSFVKDSALALLTPSIIEDWVRSFQETVATEADAEGLAPRDYACTLLGALVGSDCAVFFQIGDGLIVVATPDEPGEYIWVFWPQRGEYENVTYFATEPNFASHLEFSCVMGKVDEVAISTDGLQRLALQYDTQTVFQPFFRPMFAPLGTLDSGESAELSGALAIYLDSERVCERTDDDKTLVLASRRSLEDEHASKL